VLELSVVKYLLKKTNYAGIRDSIDITDFSKEVHSILRTIDGYFTTAEDDAPDLSVDDLSNLYFSTNRAKVDFYTGVFDNLRTTEASDYSTLKLVDALKRNRLLREVSIGAYELAEGRGDYQQLQSQLAQLDKPEGELCDSPSEIDDFVSTDLGELVSECTSVAGCRWRLDSLNKSLGSLRKGDFGFLFARPETGKTTFLASEVSFMASQTASPVLWFNLEEQGSKVMLRIYQAALGITMEALMSDIEGNRQRYLDATNDNIRLYDSATVSSKNIEKICEKYQPALVIFDQIDKIKGFEHDREDLRLGSIYIWARELAKKYCPIIAVCQADGSGEGQRWLSMANVANAKTSKQAEADWILGIGKVNDAGYDNLRFMHLSKNKLIGDTDSNPTLRHNRWETIIESTTARYRDL
jgi:KaiC/GvpD/RAD55 family RecA-like ATPase